MARFNKETENLKQVLIKRNQDLEPYLKIVQKTMSVEASLERPSSTPTQKGAYSTKSSGTTSAKSLDTSKIEDSPELARERMIADARKLMDKELTDAKIEEENKRVQAVVEANNKIGENSAMLNEWEKELNQQKIQERYEMLDNLAYIFGAESDLGKAALIAKQVLAAKELAIEISKTITFAATTEAKATASIAAGTAETAKIGFPQNIPMLIGYAAQAAAIIMSVKSATVS